MIRLRAPSVAIAIAVALAGSAIAMLAFAQPKSSPQTPDLHAQTQGDAASAQIERGRYLVALGDCVACHTREGGERFAGGRPLQTPFGVVKSANITPDPGSGIGQWTADQFYRALHEGINADGQHLYPAFPYTYYTHITRADADAIFAFLRSLPPAIDRPDRNQLPFPFNIRGLMVVWNWLFLDAGEYRPDPSKSAQWNRGAYLVQGLGHCGACHTPRNFLGGPQRDHAFQGGRFANWFAPDITSNRRTGVGGWDDDALREFLRRGLNVHSAASAEMGEVVAFSTSQMNDADLDAVLTYLRDLPASPATAAAAPDAAVMKQGEAIWQDDCAACHRMDGRGVPRFFPPLKGNPNVQQADPTTPLHFILAGTRRVPTDAAPTPLAMPAFYWKLDDAQVAAVATYVRNSWGNAAPPVRAEDVKALRDKLPLGTQRPEIPAATDMAKPGAGTLAPPGSDSRDNGSPRAGSPAASSARLPAAAASAASSPAEAGAGASSPQGSADATAAGSGTGSLATSGASAPQRPQPHGHPAGVPTGGPG